MIRVSVDVGSAGLSLAVVAESIGRALRLVEDRYPGADLKVVFPLDPDGFFAVGPTEEARIESGFPEKVAV